MKFAILPAQLIDKPPKLVSQLQPGESGYIIFTDMTVDSEHQCFVDRSARLHDIDTFSIIEVRRDETGCHLIVNADQKYVPKKLSWLKKRLWKLVPVASVTVRETDTKCSKR